MAEEERPEEESPSDDDARDERRDDSTGGEAEERYSTVDAMGQDKHRKIIGEGYGPSRGRQLLYYGVFIGVIVALFIGGKIAVDELDKAPTKDRDQAPWTGTQVPPKQFE